MVRRRWNPASPRLKIRPCTLSGSEIGSGPVSKLPCPGRMELAKSVCTLSLAKSGSMVRLWSEEPCFFCLLYHWAGWVRVDKCCLTRFCDGRSLFESELHLGMQTWCRHDAVHSVHKLILTLDWPALIRPLGCCLAKFAYVCCQSRAQPINMHTVINLISFRGVCRGP